MAQMGKLMVTGTPIGNLGDLSPRAAKAMEEADFIAAEDTRVTVKLLNHLGIKKPLVSYHEHNRLERGEIICERIQNGETCVLVSDAGMPAISDPGEELVAQCAQRGIEVVAVPGPSAVTAALAISGLPTGRFTFEGFLSMNKKSRREHLEQVKNERRTMVFYEAPHKLEATLRDMLHAWGDRRVAVVRELTKIHEEVYRATLSQALERCVNEGFRGEIVLVIEGAAQEKKEFSPQEAARLAREWVEQGMTASEAAREAAKATGCKKGEIYRIMME